MDTPPFFFRVSKNFRGAKRGVPPKNFAFFFASVARQKTKLKLQPIYSLIRWLFLSKFNEEGAHRRFCPPPLNRVKIVLDSFLRMGYLLFLVPSLHKNTNKVEWRRPQDAEYQLILSSCSYWLGRAQITVGCQHFMTKLFISDIYKLTHHNVTGGSFLCCKRVR